MSKVDTLRWKLDLSEASQCSGCVEAVANSTGRFWDVLEVVGRDVDEDDAENSARLACESNDENLGDRFILAVSYRLALSGTLGRAPV